MGKIKNAYGCLAVAGRDEKIERGAGHMVGLVCGARDDLEIIVCTRSVGAGKRIGENIVRGVVGGPGRGKDLDTRMDEDG